MTLVDKLTEDVDPRPEAFTRPPANPYVDALFKSWGGEPGRVNNWQAIALSFLEVAVDTVTGKLHAKPEGGQDGSS